ncbi:hypothetical protein ACLQ3L_28590 [Nocardia salmonicida]
MSDQVRIRRNRLGVTRLAARVRRGAGRANSGKWATPSSSRENTRANAATI